jgi:hypothetical protein
MMSPNLHASQWLFSSIRNAARAQSAADLTLIWMPTPFCDMDAAATAIAAVSAAPAPENSVRRSTSDATGSIAQSFVAILMQCWFHACRLATESGTSRAGSVGSPMCCFRSCGRGFFVLLRRCLVACFCDVAGVRGAAGFRGFACFRASVVSAGLRLLAVVLVGAAR